MIEDGKDNLVGAVWKALLFLPFYHYNQNTMKISEQEKVELESLYQYFLKEPRVQRMKAIPMHFGSNCYVHSFKVAKYAIKRAIRYHKKVNLESLLIACILHDYYLYNWRDEKKLRKLHGKRHPYIASEKAKADFNISPLCQEIIKSHMWPLNILEFPKTREAKILSFADKWTAIKEFSTSTKRKKKREEQTLLYISKLF